MTGDSAGGASGRTGSRGGDEGTEPDYRFSLANERTFLAYIRTSLALLAGGVVLEQLIPPFGIRGSRSALSIVLLCLAGVVAGSSYLRWRQTERALRLQLPLPVARLPLLLGVGLLLTSLAVLVLVVLKVTA